MNKIFSLIFLLHITFFSVSTAQNVSFVVYNIENLFDADGIALYNDYKPFDKDGNPNYTNHHVATKIKNAVELIRKFNDGNGPDLLALVELESDSSPGKWPNLSYFFNKYSETTLDKMLGEEFDDSVKTLPSHLLLAKGFWDAGIRDYDIAIAPAFGTKSGNPESVQQNALFSRLPINHAKTKRHKTERARPILETWVEKDGAELAIFVNHWKSGSGNYKDEIVRQQNASVLRARVDELSKENPNVDFIISGDLNTDYNQKYRYKFEKSAINDVLQAIGDEKAVSLGKEMMYNLWYELQPEKRGSDTYRGKFGNLMHIIVSSGLYDFSGWQYADNTFSVARFPGFNTKSFSNEPLRWFGGKNPGGYSDHFPLYAEFTVVSQNKPKKKLALTNPGIDDGATVGEYAITYNKPEEGSFKSISELSNENMDEMQNEIFLVEGVHLGDGKIKTGDIELPTYGPGFDFKEALQKASDEAGNVRFFAVLNVFRGNWQWYIDTPIFIDP